MRGVRLLAAAALLALLPGPARAQLTETWQSHKNVNNKNMFNLPAPVLPTSPMRISDVAVGAGYLKAPGLNTLPLTASATIPFADVVGVAPVGATYITQTADATLTAEQALGSLASGMMQSLTTTGVVSTFAAGAARVPFGSGTNGTLTDSALVTGGPAGGAYGSPFFQVTSSAAGTPGFVAISSSTDGFAAARSRWSNVAAGDSSYLQIGINGTNYATVGLRTANSAHIDHNTATGNLLISSTNGDTIIGSLAGLTERMRIANAGNVSIANLSAGGMVRADTSGVLSIAVAGTDYQVPGAYITALTGDGTASGPGSAVFILASVVTPGNCTYCSATFDAKGRATAFSSGATPALASRTLTAGDGMTGGGDLSADRTLNVVANADGTMVVNANDIQAGVMQTANIANDAITNAKSANMATATFKARVTAGTGDPEDITGTQATTLLDVFTSGVKGLAPASGGGTTNFLRADGTYAVPPGTGGSGTVTTVTGTAPIFITSTPTTTPNVTIQGSVLDGSTGTGGQNLGALTSGVLQGSVAAGVSTVSAFSAAANAVPFGAAGGSLLLDQDTSNLVFDKANNRLVVGNAGAYTPAAGGHSITTTSTAAPGLTINSASSATPPSVTSGQLRLNQTGSDHPGLTFTKGSTVAGAIRSQSGGTTELYANSYTFHTSPTSQTTTVTMGTNLAAGALHIPFGSHQTALLLNRSGSGTRQDILRTTSGTGALTFGVGTSDNNTFSLLSNNASRINITGGGAIEVPSGNTFAMYNVDGANSESVRAYWSGSVWHLDSEETGSGTLRGMSVDVGSVTMSLTDGGAWDVTAPLARMQNSFASLAVDSGASSSIAGLSIPTVASGASAVLDSIRFQGGALISGTTPITTATGFNAVTFKTPTYDTNGAGVSVGPVANVVIEGDVTQGANVTLGSNYALWVQSGISRFAVDAGAAFEFAGDGTGNTSAAVGRIPISITGVGVRYLRYYTD